MTTPAGDLVAMVHCNNGASELGAWADVFGQFATRPRATRPARDEVFGALLREALDGDADGGGLLAYNYLSGEPITGLTEGRPLVVRTPDSRLTLANFMRTQVYSAFGTLSLGMRVLRDEGVEVDSMYAHGGLFRTAGCGAAPARRGRRRTGDGRAVRRRGRRVGDRGAGRVPGRCPRAGPEHVPDHARVRRRTLGDGAAGRRRRAAGSTPTWCATSPGWPIEQAAVVAL